MNFIDPFVEFIKDQIDDPTFAVKIKPEWGSEKPDYRMKIREFLANVDSSYFNREQLAQHYNLNQRPQAAEGFISISHCTQAGGYSFSQKACGFDLEDVMRISDPIIRRTSTDDERAKAPHLKFLWVAKEAAYKALSDDGLLITDLLCKNWLQTTGLDIWSYQMRSEKKINTEQNIGYVFSTPTLLLAIYFK